jgi:hypothetical protein
LSGHAGSPADSDATVDSDRSTGAVYREAAKQTYDREGRNHPEGAVWSPGAVAAFARAARLAPEDRLQYALECLGSVFGRPGQAAVSAPWTATPTSAGGRSLTWCSESTGRTGTARAKR